MMPQIRASGEWPYTPVRAAAFAAARGVGRSIDDNECSAGRRAVTVLACSHVVIATGDVPRITRFFGLAFAAAPRFENEMFSEFVLPSRFRIAFFKPVGSSARSFQASADRGGTALGITVADADAAYRRLGELSGEFGIQLSGPPKEHPWGEKSFLLTDPDGNRWEITQTPSADGMLTDR